MLDCLIDYVGLSYADGVYQTSESGLYMNSMAGITIESIDKIADSEQGTYVQVWVDIQKMAALRFEQDVTSEISGCRKLSAYCDYQDLICENAYVLARAWMYMLATQLMIERIYSTRINRFTTIDVAQAKELKDFYQAEYDGALKQAVGLMDTTACDLCCDENPKYVTWLP